MQFALVGNLLAECSIQIRIWIDSAFSSSSISCFPSSTIPNSSYILSSSWFFYLSFPSQAHIGLSLYDASGQGFLRESDLETYIYELIPTMPQLKHLQAMFLPFYVCTATRYSWCGLVRLFEDNLQRNYNNNSSHFGTHHFPSSQEADLFPGSDAHWESADHRHSHQRLSRRSAGIKRRRRAWREAAFQLVLRLLGLQSLQPVPLHGQRSQRNAFPRWVRLYLTWNLKGADWLVCLYFILCLEVCVFLYYCVRILFRNEFINFFTDSPHTATELWRPFSWIAFSKNAWLSAEKWTTKCTWTLFWPWRTKTNPDHSLSFFGESVGQVSW